MLSSRLSYYISSIPTLFFGITNWPLALARLIQKRPCVIVLKNGLKFRVRSAMDVWIVKENCLDRQYERAGVEIEGGWMIVDIGAALGDFAISVAKRNPGSQVHAYEPYPESFELMSENLKLNRIDNVKAYPCAVSAKAGARQMALGTHAVEHSTVIETRKMSGHGVQVQGVTLDQVLETTQAPVCDYMKMDCEGAEFEILAAASAETLSRIKRICLEYHDSPMGRDHNELVRLLRARGFRVNLVPNPAHGNLGLLFGERRMDAAPLAS